jgi:hypothetical protein
MNNWRFDIVVTAAVDPDHVLLDVDRTLMLNPLL